MNIYELISDSPWVSFFIAGLLVHGAVSIVRSFLRYCIDRPLRHWTIRLRGYPPEHCDVDGDFKPEKDSD